MQKSFTIHTGDVGEPFQVRSNAWYFHCNKFRPTQRSWTVIKEKSMSNPFEKT